MAFIELTEELKASGHISDGDRVWRSNLTNKGAVENSQYMNFKDGKWRLRVYCGFALLGIDLQEHQAKAILRGGTDHVFELSVIDHQDLSVQSDTPDEDYEEDKNRE